MKFDWRVLIALSIVKLVITIVFITTLYHDPPEVVSWLPTYVCYNVWQAAARHHVDQGVHVTRHLYDHAPFDPSRVRDGDAIFVKTDMLDDFVLKRLPTVRAGRLTIIIGHSDCKPGDEALARLNADSKVARWMAMHLRVSQRSSKGFGIPIGLAEPDRPYGDQRLVARYVDEATSAARRVSKVFFPPVGDTHPVRAVVRDLCRGIPAVDIALEKTDYETYLRALTRYRWVLCPRGNGADVHRVWEALLLRCIPIYVADSPANVPEVYSRFPAIVVVPTPEALEKTIASQLTSAKDPDWDAVRDALRTEETFLRCKF